MVVNKPPGHPPMPQPAHRPVALSPAVQRLREQLRRALDRDDRTREALVRIMRDWLNRDRN